MISYNGSCLIFRKISDPFCTFFQFQVPQMCSDEADLHREHEGFIPPGYGDGTVHVSSLSFFSCFHFIVSVLGQDAQLSNHAFNLHLDTPDIFLLFQNSHGQMMVPDLFAGRLGYHGAQAHVSFIVPEGLGFH